jgi:hypothetical protein
MIEPDSSSPTESDGEDTGKGTLSGSDSEGSGGGSSSSSSGSDSASEYEPTHEYKNEDDRINFNPTKRSTSQHLQFQRALQAVFREHVNDALTVKQQTQAVGRYVQYIHYIYVYIIYIYIYIATCSPCFRLSGRWLHFLI